MWFITSIFFTLLYVKTKIGFPCKILKFIFCLTDINTINNTCILKYLVVYKSKKCSEHCKIKSANVSYTYHLLSHFPNIARGRYVKNNKNLVKHPYWIRRRLWQLASTRKPVTFYSQWKWWVVLYCMTLHFLTYLHNMYNQNTGID